MENNQWPAMNSRAREKFRQSFARKTMQNLIRWLEKSWKILEPENCEQLRRTQIEAKNGRTDMGETGPNKGRRDIVARIECGRRR